jgi:hypothetical protein
MSSSCDPLLPIIASCLTAAPDSVSHHRRRSPRIREGSRTGSSPLSRLLRDHPAHPHLSHVQRPDLLFRGLRFGLLCGGPPRAASQGEAMRRRTRTDGCGPSGAAPGSAAMNDRVPCHGAVMRAPFFTDVFPTRGRDPRAHDRAPTANGRTAGDAGAGDPCHSRCRSASAPPCGCGSATAVHYPAQCRVDGRTR